MSDTEQKPAEPAAETVPVEAGGQPKRKFIGGTITIVADPNTGALSVDAPDNLVIALGLLEMGKAILIQRQVDNMKAQPKASPRIVPAGMDALKNLPPGLIKH